ncbi:MAG TPA: hypothetical protein VK699_02660 [Terriglobales bacterium]|jgi:hypothetical protein|nr:hypothetical protein [Terriglobales bacterium]
METAKLEYYKNVLEKAGVSFTPALTAREIQNIEEEYSFRFPPDLRDFLMFALPVSNGFINWRHTEKERIRDRLGWPLEGMCFDIENNVFWRAEWGERPASLNVAFNIAREAVKNAPTLIPIASHRYIPDRPNEPGNPVFSVHQTDIIYYGTDLFDYFENEFSYYFRGPGQYFRGVRHGCEIKHIEFWSNLVE